MSVLDRQTAKQDVKKIPTRPKPASRQSTAAPAEGLKRKLPGTPGEGHYYHIVIRPKHEFVTFRTQAVGRKGHVQRVAGQRTGGAWATVKWLIAKRDAHIEDGKLVPDTKSAREAVSQLGSDPVRVKGDFFEARPGRELESAEPTAVQKRSPAKDVKKARAAQRKSKK